MGLPDLIGFTGAVGARDELIPERRSVRPRVLGGFVGPTAACSTRQRSGLRSQHQRPAVFFVLYLVSFYFSGPKVSSPRDVFGSPRPRTMAPPKFSVQCLLDDAAGGDLASLAMGLAFSPPPK